MTDVFQTVAANWRDGFWWRKYALPYAVRRLHDHLPDSGVDILEEDWDNLILLDACRYDMFSSRHELPGELARRRSRGSNTPEFLRSNFVGRDCRDVVYVTANPQVNVYLQDECFEIRNVWEERWDEKLDTVPPSAMAEATVEAYREYPDKRLIAHFVQPHYPFIGDTGRSALAPHSGMELSKREVEGEDAVRDRASVWDQLYEGLLSADLVWRAYTENLDITLPHVQHLLDVFEGRTVVTSDHGNAVGERCWPIPTRIYGHPPGIRIPAIVDIPWLVVEGGQRKQVVRGDASSTTTGDRDVVERRLSDLGYT